MRKPKIFKNPRREALATLREIKTRVAWLIQDWDVTSTVYELGNGGRRRREDSEYPENQQESWVGLYQQAEALILQAERLREFAAQQCRTLRDQQSA